jgi:hypothetical protein
MMVCFAGPGAFVTALIALVLYRAWATIETIVHWCLVVAGWIAYTVIGAAAAFVLALAIMAVWWTGQRIRRWQQARGACMTCAHPCIGELRISAKGDTPAGSEPEKVLASRGNVR